MGNPSRSETTFPIKVAFPASGLDCCGSVAESVGAIVVGEATLLVGTTVVGCAQAASIRINKIDVTAKSLHFIRGTPYFPSLYWLILTEASQLDKFNLAYFLDRPE
jgi:hypothetical protein